MQMQSPNPRPPPPPSIGAPPCNPMCLRLQPPPAPPPPSPGPPSTPPPPPPGRPRSERPVGVPPLQVGAAAAAFWRRVACPCAPCLLAGADGWHLGRLRRRAAGRALPERGVDCSDTPHLRCLGWTSTARGCATSKPGLWSSIANPPPPFWTGLGAAASHQPGLGAAAPQQPASPSRINLAQTSGAQAPAPPVPPTPLPWWAVGPQVRCASTNPNTTPQRAGGIAASKASMPERARGSTPPREKRWV